MSTQPITSKVRWQDMRVKSEADTTLEIAHQENWEDCEIFGYGKMITKPQELMGWKLIPADLYEYSIPAEGVERVHQIIEAGVQIQGVIIADDERSVKSQPSPTKPKVSLSSFEKVLSSIAKLLLVSIFVVGGIFFSLIFLVPLVITGLLTGPAGMSMDYDPKLVILVDDGNGGTVWISLFTWYE